MRKQLAIGQRCANGHLMTEANLVMQNRANGMKVPVCRDCRRESSQRHRDKIGIDAARARTREWHRANRDRTNPARTQRYRALKREVMDAYGGRCACCGETEITMLTIDHVNDDGYLDKETGRRAGRLYSRVKKEGYPDRYQCLCANCNTSKAVNGGVCAHALAA